MKHKIISRAPLRLGLAGGGTDLRLFSSSFGGNVVNITIKKYIYCKIIPIKKKFVIFESQDQKIKFKYFFSNSNRLNKNSSNKNNLLKNIYFFVRDKYNNKKDFPVKIVTYSEVPNGSGLGGSSTFVIAVLSGLLRYFNKKISKRKLVEDAIFIERKICNIPGGFQDQYSAVFGGLNFLIFKKNGDVNILNIKYKKSFIKTLESNIILFYYKKKRNSVKVINNQNLNIFKKNSKAIYAFKKLKQSAIKLKTSIEKNKYRNFINILNKGWEEKKKTSSLISNKDIDNIVKNLFKIGADAVKVSGAGGGGFFFILCKLENRSKLINYLSKKNGILTETCNITFEGVQTWHSE